MDLHNLFALPEEYNDEKYGKNNYEKMLSFIDFWLGKFLQNIDLKNTLIVISSDHGSYIPLTQTNPDEIPKYSDLHAAHFLSYKKKFPLCFLHGNNYSQSVFGLQATISGCLWFYSLIWAHRR